MTPPRRVVLMSAGIVLLALAVGYALRPKPDLTLFGPDARIFRSAVGTGLTGPARLELSFTRASADAALDVGVDLNGDGTIAAYPTVGGAHQEEWLVRGAAVKVAPGPQRFLFDIVDPDIVTRNNFKLTAVLTKEPLKDWHGEVSADAIAALHADIPSIKPSSL